MRLTKQINRAGIARLSLCAVAVLALAVSSAAQPAATDSLRLGALRAAAVEQDPRAVQPDLLARATDLRLAALRAQRLPQFSLTGQATLQNEVPSIPIRLPDQSVPSPPREQFRAQAEADWTLFDGGRVARQSEAERARLAENVAGVAVTLDGLRDATTEAFFAALLFDAQADVLALADEDLAARVRTVERRAEAGAALRADVAALEAERIRVQQAIDEAEAGRRAALAVLADLTGIDPTASALALPTLDAATARALAALDAETEAVQSRPELVRFARTAERAEAEARAAEAQTRPTVGLFAQAGVGRPSPFDFLSDDVSEFGIAGVRVRWPLFDGGRARREAAALRVQADLAETEAAAFARQIERSVADDRAALDRLDATRASDRRIVELREEVLRAARRQLDEGVLLPDVYTDRLTDLAEARLTRERHRIERVQAQARLLTALGRYPEPPVLPLDRD